MQKAQKPPNRINAKISLFLFSKKKKKIKARLQRNILFTESHLLLLLLLSSFFFNYPLTFPSSQGEKLEKNTVKPKSSRMLAGAKSAGKLKGKQKPVQAAFSINQYQQ